MFSKRFHTKIGRLKSITHDLLQTGRPVVQKGWKACDGQTNGQPFPQGHADFDETMNALTVFFEDPDLGLSKDEQQQRAVVLMGAHGLGEYTGNCPIQIRITCNMQACLLCNCLLQL